MKTLNRSVKSERKLPFEFNLQFACLWSLSTYLQAIALQLRFWLERRISDVLETFSIQLEDNSNLNPPSAWIACYLEKRQLGIFVQVLLYAIFITPLCNSADFLTLSIHIVFLQKCYSQAASYTVREHATNFVSSAFEQKWKREKTWTRRLLLAVWRKIRGSTLYSENNNSAASSGNLFCSFLITTSETSHNEKNAQQKYFDYVPRTMESIQLFLPSLRAN